MEDTAARARCAPLLSGQRRHLRARSGRLNLSPFHALLIVLVVGVILVDFVRTAEAIARQDAARAAAQSAEQRACRRWDDSVRVAPEGGPTCGL